MNKTTKWYAKPLYAVMALALVAGLMMVPAVVPVSETSAAAAVAALELEIIQPEKGAEVVVCNNFSVNATIASIGTANATNVTVSIHPGDYAELVAGAEIQTIGTLNVSKSGWGNWTLHCIGEGDTIITVSASADSVNLTTKTVTVHQFPSDAALTVGIAAPSESVVVGQNFEVIATVNNTGGATAKSVNATLNITALVSAEWVSGDVTQLLDNIAGGESAIASWWLRCTGAGSAVINVTAMGLNSTNVIISNSTQVSVKQIVPTRPHLVAEIYEPTGEQIVIPVCNTFSVAANITNTGNETALACNATVSWEAGNLVELISGDSSIKTLGNISGGSTHPVKWTLHCKGEGAVNITVTPAGLDDLTWEALNATTDITSDNVTVEQLEKEKLAVNITAPEDLQLQQGYCQNFTVTANITNIGYAAVHNVNATISFNTSLANLVSGDNPIGIGTLQKEGYNSTGANWTLHCIGPGNLTITVNATGIGNMTNTTITAIPDSVTVIQHAEEALNVNITGPAAGTKYGVGENFTVTANISNTGWVNVTGINATISFNTSLAELVSGTNPIGIGTLPKFTYNNTGANWTLHCTGKGDLIITVNATGIGNYTHSSVNATGNVTVEQKYLKVVITEPTAQNRTICVTNEFFVNVTFYNYHPQFLQGVTTDINITGPAHVVSPTNPTLQSVGNIEPGANATVPIPWHIHCDGPGTVIINVTAMGIAGGAQGPTITNWGEITIQQKNPAALSVNITSPVTCHWYNIGENFTVNASIANTGDALATGVNATLNITGNAVNITALTQLVGNITGGGSNTTSWNVTCTGPGNVTLYVSVNGTDSVCGGYKTGISPTVIVHQLPLEVTITENPTGNVTVCSNFGISANITHNATSSVDVLYVNATINIVNVTGNATVAPGESITKTIGNITRGKTQEVEWTVHCDGAGAVNITVTAKTVVGNGQTMNVTSEPVTVTQVPATPTPTISYNVSLAKDWNYMSLPLMVENTTIESVLASIAGKYIEVWAYNASSGTWKYYNPTWSDAVYTSAGLTKLTKMEDGVGYAIRMKEPRILTGQGYELPTGAALPPEYLLEKGWNLVGFKTMDFNRDSSITQAADTMKAGHYLMNLDADNDGTIIGKEARFFQYYEPNDGWKALTDASNMWVGKGYWLYASETGLSIVPPIAQT